MSGIIDGLLLTGGDDIPPEYYGRTSKLPAGGGRLEKSERVEFEMALLSEVLFRDKPVFAICYGMQLLNVVHGGTLIEDIKSAANRYSVHTEGTHEVVVTDSFYSFPQKSYNVNSFHHQAVDKMGDGLSVFAVSDDGIIEGIYKRDYNHCVGVQWHPERIRTEPLSGLLFKLLADKACEARRRR